MLRYVEEQNMLTFALTFFFRMTLFEPSSLVQGARLCCSILNMAALFQSTDFFHLILSDGYKVISDEATLASNAANQSMPSSCNLASRSEISCADVVRESPQARQSTWSQTCPGVNHPMGASRNGEFFAKSCANECGYQKAWPFRTHHALVCPSRLTLMA